MSRIIGCFYHTPPIPISPYNTEGTKHSLLMPIIDNHWSNAATTAHPGPPSLSLSRQNSGKKTSIESAHNLNLSISQQIKIYLKLKSIFPINYQLESPIYG